MKKNFRFHHLFQILDSFNSQLIPLDIHLTQYFRNHKALGAKDRKFIGEKIYQLIRWQGLIDHYCTTNSWEERYETLEKLDLNKSISDSCLPLHIRSSSPKLLFDLLAAQFGQDQAFALCLASNTKAPLTIRINPLKTTREELFSKWQNEFSISKTSFSPYGINFNERINFSLLETFKQGLFEVQDEASQLVADLLHPQPGDLVLDYCAGAGGKSLAFAHKLQGKGQIYLHDIRASVLKEAKKRLKRAGIENGQILLSTAPYKANLQNKMDWVFVDVPCTGLGTLRRNPDLKWKFSKELLERLVLEQRKIFESALAYLHPKGKIVYATCSMLPQENEQQITYFQEKYGLEIVGKFFHSFPTEGGMDGFFGAVLKKMVI